MSNIVWCIEDAVADYWRSKDGVNMVELAEHLESLARELREGNR